MTPAAWRLGDMFSQAASKLPVPEIRAHTVSYFMEDEDSHPTKNARVTRPKGDRGESQPKFVFQKV